MGHKFRSGWLKLSTLLAGVEELGTDEKHKGVLQEMIEDLHDPELNRMVAEKGAIRVFHENKDRVLEIMKAQDPEQWDRFIESQKLTQANLTAEKNGKAPPPGSGETDAPPSLPPPPCDAAVDEAAVSD